MHLELGHLTYSRVNLNDHLLDDNLPSFPCPPQPPHSPTTGLGTLDALPLELMCHIISQLDLRTLPDFGLANRQAYCLLTSHHQYKAIITHARNALYGILSIQTGRWIACSTLYNTLCTSKCDQCDDFGGYIYLLTCRRVCFLCLSQQRGYLPLLPTHACQKFGLDRRLIKSIPHVKALPGIYSPNEKKVTRPPTLLVDYESALEAGVELHGSVSSMNDYALQKKIQNHNSRLWNIGRRDRRARRSWVSDPFDGHSGNPFRFVAIAHVPWLDRKKQKPVWGFHCLGCADSCEFPLHFRRKYIATTFEDHLRQCGDVQDGQHQPHRAFELGQKTQSSNL